MTSARVPNTSLNEGTPDAGDVVLRNPKKLGQLSFLKEESGGGKPGEKRVKWSESTELREKMKVYRRSQLDIPLDYHHIALEEKREKEGVKEWRSSLHKDEDDDEDELQQSEAHETAVLSPTEVTEVAESESDSTDTEERVSSDHVDLDMMLHVIKIKSTKYTVYPAYCAAIKTYQEWLSDSNNTKNLPQDTVTNMRAQLDLYKSAVSKYEAWADHNDNKTACLKYEEISLALKKASDLGPPPDAVTKALNDTLNNEENSQKQVKVYNEMVQEIIMSIDSVEV
ncbi:uncharacterized protein LOC106072566 [Biomphalaria glabrata]|uniref:Uncharacterized protein LOC106072566 n=1 Tax=Biomphalaria glabrata TaxID=6526 RepID=A0A9W2ZA08_BIOGL|nr:uncharacterized protein LOC106072566 [Biomphalaria glabrata]